ncbi:MAG: hypothetical protein ACTSUO_05160, partial [Candidatus Thorarchaeota archaeon]
MVGKKSALDLTDRGHHVYFIKKTVCIILCLTLFLGLTSSMTGFSPEIIQQEKGISVVDEGFDSWLSVWRYHKAHHITEPEHGDLGKVTLSYYLSDLMDPFIDTPQDMNIEAGALNNSIQWIVTEENQSRYYILVN